MGWSCFCSLWWFGLPATYLLCWGFSPVPSDVSAELSLCQLSVSPWLCCFHVTWPSVREQVPNPSIHTDFLVGYPTVFGITSSAVQLLRYDVTDGFYFSVLHLIMHLYICAVHSIESSRAAVPSSFHIVFSDGLTISDIWSYWSNWGGLLQPGLFV